MIYQEEVVVLYDLYKHLLVMNLMIVLKGFNFVEEIRRPIYAVEAINKTGSMYTL